MFTYPTINETQLEGIQHQYYDAVKSSKSVKNVHFLTIGDLKKCQLDEKLTIHLPNELPPVVATATNVEYNNEKNYTWRGVFPDELGTITLISRDSAKYGYLTYDDVFYSIDDIGGNLDIISETIKDNGICGADFPEVNEANALPLVPCGEVDPIKILVLYTDKAKKYGSPTNAANKGIEQLKEAFKNSNIKRQVTLVAVEASPTADYDVDPSTTTGVITQQTLYNRIASMPSYFQSIREKYLADLVVLLYRETVEGDIIGAVYGGAGFGGHIYPDDERSFAMVNIQNATDGNYTFVHEIGHLFGCGHEDGVGSAVSYAKAKVTKWTGLFGIKKYRSTVMTGGLSTEYEGEKVSAAKILHFSNPDVNYSVWGVPKPTGVMNERNNARRIGESGCTIAGFFPDKLQIIAGLDIGNLCLCKTTTLEPSISQGTAPFTYKWETSQDGVNYTTLNIITPTYDFSIGCKKAFIGTTRYVRLTITAFGGETLVLYSQGKIISCDEPPVTPNYPNDAKDSAASFTVTQDNKM